MGMKKSEYNAPFDSDSKQHYGRKRTTVLRQGDFEKFEIPSEFEGTFGKLFDLLLVSYGSVAIALYRYFIQNKLYSR